MSWTQEQLDTLHAGYHSGKSYGIIAHEIGKTRNAVIGKARRLGFMRRPEECGKPRQPKKRLPCLPGGAASVAIASKPRPALLSDPHIFPIQMNPAPILDLKPGQCRFALNGPKDDTDADTHFCGGPVREGSSYCEHHHARVWQPYKRKKGHRPKKVDHAQFIYGVAA